MKNQKKRGAKKTRRERETKKKFPPPPSHHLTIGRNDKNGRQDPQNDRDSAPRRATRFDVGADQARTGVRLRVYHPCNCRTGPHRTLRRTRRSVRRRRFGGVEAVVQVGRGAERGIRRVPVAGVDLGEAVGAHDALGGTRAGPSRRRSHSRRCPLSDTATAPPSVATARPNCLRTGRALRSRFP